MAQLVSQRCAFRWRRQLAIGNFDRDFVEHCLVEAAFVLARRRLHWLGTLDAVAGLSVRRQSCAENARIDPKPPF
jgi:hypothetical protein